jgi:hypothetical protein
LKKGLLAAVSRAALLLILMCTPPSAVITQA